MRTYAWVPWPGADRHVVFTSRRVATPLLCLQQILKSALRFMRVIVPVRPAPARGSDPPLLAHHSTLAEEAGREFQAVEPVHVGGAIAPGEKDGCEVRLCRRRIIGLGSDFGSAG